MLLQDDDGPLLLAALLELGDVGLVLPPLPVGADHDLGLPQLDQSEGLARSRDQAGKKNLPRYRTVGGNYRFI